MFCWGDNYNREVKISPESLITKKIPKKVLDKADKVAGFKTGGAFAVCYALPSTGEMTRRLTQTSKIEESPI